MQKLYFPGIMAVCVLICAAAAPATVYNLTPSDNWYGVISGTGLLPGDEVILQSGVYTTSSWLPIGHQGTAENPIIIRAADGATPVFTKSRTDINNMDVQGARYLTIRGLEITGADTAIRIYENGAGEDAKFVTIEDCHIHHVGGNGITANHGYQTYEGMVFRGNEINNTGGHGEAFYLGSNNDALGNTVSVFYNGLIEKNYIHDLVGGTISQGDGIEIKDGSYGNIVRDNVIFNTNYPGIIVYGTDGNAPNIIERNVVIGTNDNGIQAAAEAIVRNNIIMNAGASGIGSHTHQSAVPGNLEIVNNTIIALPGNDAVHISLYEPASGPITVANNALYGGTYVPGGTILAGNVTSTNLSADFGDVASYDFFPIPGSSVIGAGNVAYVVADDFNGTARGGVADAGAYLYDADGNPGWPISQDFKVIPFEEPPPPPPEDVWMDHEIKYVNGKYGITFILRCDDGIGPSAIFAEMIYEGTNGGQLEQVSAFGTVSVDDEASAELYDGIPAANYDKDQDSWFMDAFAGTDASILVLNESANFYEIESGTPAGELYEDLSHAYIVCTGDVAYTGQVARAQWWNVVGVVDVPPPGDANRDDAVDGLDYVVWSNNYMQTDVGWEGADFNGDGVADGLDYVLWSNFYNPQPGGLVPEPTSLLLLAVGVLASLRRGRRR